MNTMIMDMDIMEKDMVSFNVLQANFANPLERF